MLADLLLSVVLGFIIGFERKIRFKEAGIRTHTIVCAGSALMMIISKYAFTGADSARVAAQIVTGVGFLGAGMIVYRRNEVRGLTTAAGVWATAGVGMACGGRLYVVALGAAIIIISAQCLFHLPFKVFHSKRYYAVKIEFVQSENENLIIKSLFGVDRFNHLVIKRENGQVIYSATLNTDKEFSSTKLNEIMAENEFVLSIERDDDLS
ncbi:MAG: MgtC/SapB family protein [Clostridiales bacterium]|nr:MgtC/SapB family protein [Clostridiales bacterium]